MEASHVRTLGLRYRAMAPSALTRLRTKGWLVGSRHGLRPLAIAVALVLSGVPLPVPAASQSILVQITEAETQAPVQGAFVSLLDDQDAVVRSALTNETGRFLFVVSSPGRYRVRAEMIGRETGLSDPVVLGANEAASVTVALPVQAIVLAGIEVSADEQCHLRPAEATALGQVWEEARRALSVQAWAEEVGAYRLNLTIFDRDLDADGRTVERETRRGLSGVTRTPFVSLPPEDLLESGFIRPLEEGGHQYYGPDASVLLSDLFLRTHCFRLTRSKDHPGSVGLSFEPARRSEMSDIEGTLWLEEATAKLQVLEFGYTRVPYREAQTVANGRVEFEALPDGVWIIKRWWIRAPIMGFHPTLARAGDAGIRVAGIRETGGEVTRVSTLADKRVSEVVRSSLSGMVWDSTRAVPLEGATVYLSGTQYAAVTDGEGRFELDGLPEGVYSAAFEHPRLDSLGLMLPGVEVEMEEGSSTELRLAIPSEASILAAVCREEEQEEGTAVLTGAVTDAASGAPIPGATVRVEWQEVESVEPLVRARDRWLEARTDEEGRYVACGIPTDERITVRASFLEWESAATEEAFPAEERRVLDVAVELPPGLLREGPRASGAVEAYGAQGVQGTLVEPGSREPVRRAEVVVRDAAGQVTGSAVTDNRGFFRIQTPVPGRYVLSAQALGYAELKTQAVEVPSGKVAVVEVQMAPAALELEPLVVTAAPRSFHLEMEGFYEREAKGLDNGVFFTPEDLEERRPRKLSDVFFGLAGVRVAEPSLGAGGRAVWFRVGERPGGVCWPMVYVDRHLASPGGAPDTLLDATVLDTYVHGMDVAAVEVYGEPARIPPEFNGANAGCGVIVIWTHRGGGR